MKNSMDKVCVTCLLVLLLVVITNATDDTKDSHGSDRSGRSWHHPSLFGGGSGPQMLLPHQQQALPAAASTSQPSDTSTGNSQMQSDSTGSNRNFEDPHDKMAAPSDLDYMARQFGYLNVHRFDPNFLNYYERQAYPRYPSPQAAPRFGPGYRKDKYGHGYGYSCKQGDDCDEVRAANQLAARHPAPQRPHHPMMTFNNHYPDLPPFPSLPSDFSSLIPPSPSYQPHNSYGGGLFGAPPARFNDPHSMSSMMPPPRYYHARYLHDQEENRVEHHHKVQQQKSEESVSPQQHAEASSQHVEASPQ